MFVCLKFYFFVFIDRMFIFSLLTSFWMKSKWRGKSERELSFAKLRSTKASQPDGESSNRYHNLVKIWRHFRISVYLQKHFPTHICYFWADSLQGFSGNVSGWQRGCWKSMLYIILFCFHVEKLNKTLLTFVLFFFKYLTF